MPDETAARHEAFGQIQRSVQVPNVFLVTFFGSFGSILFFALIATSVARPALLTAVSTTVLLGAAWFEYRTLRSGLTHRRRVVERAVEVPCVIRDTHVIPASRWALDYRILYLPVIEFSYEHDGAESTSYRAYPYGVHEATKGPEATERTAAALADAAGDAAYYDPETDQAFLFDDPNRAVTRQQLESWLFTLSIRGFVLLVLTWQLAW